MATAPRRPTTAAQRVVTANALWHSARALKMAVLRAAHPDWPVERLRAEARRLFFRSH